MKSNLMKFAAASAKSLKAVKCLPKILLNIDIMAPCLLPCFCILFKRPLGSATKIFITYVVLAKLEISEPIDASQIFDGMLLSKCGIQTIEKRNASLLSLS